MKEIINYYRSGNPIQTGAITELPSKVLNTIKKLEKCTFFSIAKKDDAIHMRYVFDPRDMVIGFGETVKGLNKRGSSLESYCADEPEHLPNKKSLYGAHNFFIIKGKETRGFFIDFPGLITYDIGFEDRDIFNIKIEGVDVDIYEIIGASPKAITESFLQIIGESYVPPKWGFGYQQCRWSYESADDIRRIAKEMRDAEIPCDTIYLDIDYMEGFKDFTTCDEKFPAFESFVEEMKTQDFRLIPIIDAGVKIEKDYDVYEEGIKDNHFCVDDKGNPFTAAVWPGLVHFPDFFKDKTRQWFGDKYRILTDMGIEGFWNDMNEPAIFYTPNRLKAFYDHVEDSKEKPLDIYSFFELKGEAEGLSSSPEDYRSFYHEVDGSLVRHDKVHNLYGYYMTKSAAQGLEKIDKDKRFLLFSRASYIGMHRYAGIWMGDNHSWWEHIELAMKMLPAINMCGFMYTGCDTGGFQSDASSELLIRWTQFSLFTPLMRNHAALSSRQQEPFAFDARTTQTLKNIIELRYCLIPYLYSSYMKAISERTLYSSNLIMTYDDDRVREIDDQLLIGDNLMITPIYSQNKTGRMVYLPEDMLLWKTSSSEVKTLKHYSKGDHFIAITLEEVLLFIRPDKGIILGGLAQTVEAIDPSEITFLGYFKNGINELFYDDDGQTKAYQKGGLYKTLITVEKKNNEIIGRVLFDSRSELEIVTISVVDASGAHYSGVVTQSSTSVKLKKVNQNDK